MHKNIVKKKNFLAITIFIIIIIGFLPTTQSFTIKEKSTYLKNFYNILNEGTLSGYVKDPSNGPIEGALIRLYFHEEYRQNYSDSTGYYHITDIPICYCLKNATCSKEGYRTEWVLLAIYENTTYDFTLYQLDACYPVFNGTSGCNGWYISPVEVSFAYNPEQVAEIWYNYQGWQNYIEPFVINEEGVITVDFYWIDYEGVQSLIYNFTVYIDQTSPITEVKWEVYKEDYVWYVKFNLTVEDTLSGMAPFLEIYINNVLQERIEVSNWENVEFVCKWSKNFKFLTFGFLCSDNACNHVIEKVNGSDIKSFNINHFLYSQQLYNIYFQRLLEYFTNLFLFF